MLGSIQNVFQYCVTCLFISPCHSLYESVH